MPSIDESISEIDRAFDRARKSPRLIEQPAAYSGLDTDYELLSATHRRSGSTARRGPSKDAVASPPPVAKKGRVSAHARRAPGADVSRCSRRMSRAHGALRHPRRFHDGEPSGMQPADHPPVTKLVLSRREVSASPGATLRHDFPRRLAPSGGGVLRRSPALRQASFGDGIAVRRGRDLENQPRSAACASRRRAELC